MAERYRPGVEHEAISPTPPFRGAWEEERAKWEKKFEVAQTKGETSVEPKGMRGLPLAPKGKSWLDNVFVRALHPILGGIGAFREYERIKESGLLWKKFTYMEELPGTTAARVREEAEIALDEQARAKVMLDFYNSLSIAGASPGITSFEDYQEAFAFPAEMLSAEELQEAQDAVKRQLSGSVGTEIPDWLRVGEEEEEKVRKFLEGPEAEERIVTPTSLSQMTIEEIRKALHASAVPVAELPPDTTIEEMLQLMSVMDLPAETLGAVIDIDAAVKILRDAALEQQQMILEAKTGVREWEPPDMDWWQKAFFMVQSPMQQFADFLRPYIENVSYPLAAFAVLVVNKLQSGTQDVEKFYDEARAKGMSPWVAARETWKDWEVPWYQKLVIEIAFDPLTYVGTPIMTGVGKLLTRFGLGAIGRPLIAINKGFYIATDIPFDLFKSAMARFPKSTSQIVKRGVDDFNELLAAAVQKETGKLFTQVTPDDVALTLRKAVEEYATNPKVAEHSLTVKLGEFMSEHSALSGNKAWSWSHVYEGSLAREFTSELIPAQAVHEANQVLTLATAKQVDIKTAAAMLADTLGIERSPERLAKLMKDIPNYTKSLSTNIDNAVRVGNMASYNKVGRMLEYLNKRQKAVILSRETGKHAKGGLLEGIALGMQRGVDKIQNHRIRMAVDRWMVRPFAEGNLGSISYPIWNAFEGIVVSILEGVVPRTTRTESYLMMIKGCVGDPALSSRLASDVAGILGGAPHRMGGAWTFFPRWKVPERFAGVGVPKFIAGREFFGWFGRKWIDLSNTLGNAYRQNFVMQRMSNHLAEIAYKEAGGDIMEGLRRAIGRSPRVSKQTLGMSSQDLTQEVWRRMTVSSDDVRALKEVLTDGIMQQEEMLKVLRACDHLSPRAKTLGEQLVMEGRVLRSEDDIARFAKKVADTAVEDIRRYPYEIGSSFRGFAGEIDNMPIASTDELMEVLAAHEMMAQTASYIPHRIMSQTMDEAAELYERGAWKKLEQLWRRRREEMLTVMDEVTGSTEIVRAKLRANEALLTPEQVGALESVLERAGSSDILRGATLQSDAAILDTFWQLPRASRTAGAHSELRLARAELWTKYRADLATTQAAEFITRRDLAMLYHNLPEPRLTPVDASARALSTQDVAHVFGTNVDGLATGTLETVAIHGREYFIQLVKQSADSKPHLFKGFTEEKIGQVFDNLMAQAKMSADQDIMMQKVLQQAEGMRQGLLSLKMRHSLLPDEKLAVDQWIDNAANARDKIIVKGEGPLGKGQVSQTRWDELRQEALNRANKDYYKAFADYTNENVIAAAMKTVYPYWCIPGVYKIMTRTGWKHYSELVIGEPVLTINSHTLVTEWQPLEEVAVFDYDGEMMSLACEDKDILFTKDHRWLTVTSGIAAPEIKRGYELIDSCDLIPRVLPCEPECEIPYDISSKDALLVKLGTKHYSGKIWCPKTPNGTWIMNAEGKVLPTGNTYHTYRWFYLFRAAIRHPGTAAAWGKYQNYGQYGYQPTPIPDIEMNPFVGSVMGTTFGLTRFDFAYYYNELGFFGEMLDYSQRWGFYPGAHVMFPIALTPYLTGRKMELSEVLPPIARSAINIFVASPNDKVAKAAQGLKDKIFHENFHLYYTATLLTSKQVEAGGTLIDGQSGTDIWMKLQRDEKLTEEEQRLWDESYKLAAKYGLLRAQFPQFRLRTEDYKEAYDEVTQIFKEEFGMSEEYQKELWRHHIQPTDVVGGLPLDVRNSLDELWQWKLHFGRGTILMPPDVSDLRVLQDKYYKRRESYQKERLAAQAETDTGFLTPTLELHLSGSDWKSMYAENWSAYITKVDGLEEEPEFADAIDAMTPEGRMRVAERLGWNIPPVTPMEEAIQLYFEIELEQSVDPYTGETYDDYLSFWMKREAVRMALTEEQRLEFDRYIKKYQTPMEKVFKYAYNTYIRGYRATSRIVFESYDEELKSLIREFYSDITTSSRKAEIRETVTPDGRKLISEYESKSSDARIALRQVSPTLDFWLLTFGYTTKPRSDTAQAMFEAFEADRSSILEYAGVEEI